MQFSITAPAQAMVVSISHLNVACFDDSTGSIAVNVVGGTPGNAYLAGSGLIPVSMVSLTPILRSFASAQSDLPATVTPTPGQTAFWGRLSA